MQAQEAEDTATPQNAQGSTGAATADSQISVDTEMRGGGTFTATKEIYTFEAVAKYVYGYPGEYMETLQQANPGIDSGRVIAGKTVFQLPKMLVVKDITFPSATYDDKQPFTVPYGQKTFDAEGQEGGPYHSREPDVPSESSGVTIGRGYDMKYRDAQTIYDQLTAAGIPDSVALIYKGAAEKSGQTGVESALTWLNSKQEGAGEQTNREAVGEITKEQQWNLFIQEYQRQTDGVIRSIVRQELEKDENGQWKCRVDFENLNPKILELLIDMDYRGDLKGEWKGDFRQSVIENDLSSIQSFVKDHAEWRKDIYERYKARCNIVGVEPKAKTEAEAKPSDGK
ncbi:MAG: hypothetical protein Tsb0020_01030 [Haliangiales bacterium]